MGAETAIFTAMAAQAGSSLLSAQSAIAEGKGQLQAAKYNAKIAERNAKIAEQEADLIQRSSEYEIANFRKQFKFLSASAGNALRYNGFDASSGTGYIVQKEMAKEADTEIAARRYNATVESQRALNQAEELRMQGELGIAMGRYARSAGRYAAAGTVLSGVSSIGLMEAKRQDIT